MQSVAFENELTVETHRQNGTLETFHDNYEAAVESVRAWLGGSHPHIVGSDRRMNEETFVVTSPGERSLAIGEFPAGQPEDVDADVKAARQAFEAWSARPVRDRVDVFREAAGLMRDRKYRLAAVLTLENGKNRMEAMADIDEGIDFLRFYAREFERHDGYRFETGEPTPGQRCRNRLEPFGVFGVIGPFNFPFAIFAGMATGAMITGNTVVAKPASTTPLIAHRVVDLLAEAGLPDGVFNLVTGSGRAVGESIVTQEAVAGIAFTGSRAVGRSIQQTFLEQDKSGPVIAEMGGKNPVIVTANADRANAVSGVKHGAFGFSGQKCSATSRVYVHEELFERFTDELVEATEQLSIVPPDQREAYLAPLIDEAALERYRRVCDLAREVGTIRTGGSVSTGPDVEGRYVTPTVVTDVPHEHELATEEHFLPFVTLHPVESLEEAIRKANDSRYGLCAGLFSEDADEIDRWQAQIEAGMCYLNRGQSATTGALVQAQPFGGWKDSGATSKFAGGYWYLPQFMREQTRTVIGPIGRDDGS